MVDPNSSEEVLLARLHALRRSGTSRQNTTAVVSEDALSKRLQALRNAETSAPARSVDVAADVDVDRLLERYEMHQGTETLKENMQDLLQESSQQTLQTADMTNARRLISDARATLHLTLQHENSRGGDLTPSRELIDASPNDDITEEDIDRLLQEMNVSVEQTAAESPNVVTPDTTSEEDDCPLLELPNAPSTLTRLGTTHEDTNLPTVPSFAPSSLTASTVKSSSNSTNDKKQGLAAAQDNDVETWCIICCDDASLQCTGCDGDLYCTNCWTEGHRGEDVGLEERRHKAIAYSKPQSGKRRLQSVVA